VRASRSAAIVPPARSLSRSLSLVRRRSSLFPLCVRARLIKLLLARGGGTSGRRAALVAAWARDKRCVTLVLAAASCYGPAQYTVSSPGEMKSLDSAAFVLGDATHATSEPSACTPPPLALPSAVCGQGYSKVVEARGLVMGKAHIIHCLCRAACQKASMYCTARPWPLATEALRRRPCAKKAVCWGATTSKAGWCWQGPASCMTCSPPSSRRVRAVKSGGPAYLSITPPSSC